MLAIGDLITISFKKGKKKIEKQFGGHNKGFNTKEVKLYEYYLKTERMYSD